MITYWVCTLRPSLHSIRGYIAQMEEYPVKPCPNDPKEPNLPQVSCAHMHARLPNGYHIQMTGCNNHGRSWLQRENDTPVCRPSMYANAIDPPGLMLVPS